MVQGRIKSQAELMAERITAKKTLNLPWKHVVINSSLLHSKQDYQRPIRVDFVKESIENFKGHNVDSVHVSYRDGEYYVIDGQHTILILEGMNGGKPLDIDCIVHFGMTYEEEGDYYVEQYEKKHRHTYNEMQVAGYEAKRTEIHKMADAIRAVGGKLPYDKKAKGGLKIGAPKRVAKAFEKDADNTVLAIECLANAYKGRIKSLTGDMVAGTMEFLRMYKGEIDIHKLTDALSKDDPQTISNAAKSFKVSYPTNWTETLRDRYNKNARGRTKRIKPKFI